MSPTIKSRLAREAKVETDTEIPVAVTLGRMWRISFVRAKTDFGRRLCASPASINHKVDRRVSFIL